MPSRITSSRLQRHTDFCCFSANSTDIRSAVASDLKNSLSDFETNFSREIFSCLSDFSQKLSHDISVSQKSSFDSFSVRVKEVENGFMGIPS